MNIVIRSHPTDDPKFIENIERIAGRLFKQIGHDEVFLIEIKNWFDHKWLKFSGNGRVPFQGVLDSHPQVALDEFFQEKITFPPFTPNRVLRQRWHPAKEIKRSSRVHRTEWREHSCWNLQRRVTKYADSALSVWFSSGTKINDRGSLMVYSVQEESVSAWYVSFQKGAKGAGWRLHLTKEIVRESVISLMMAKAELHAQRGVAPERRTGFKSPGRATIGNLTFRPLEHFPEGSAHEQVGRFSGPNCLQRN